MKKILILILILFPWLCFGSSMTNSFMIRYQINDGAHSLRPGYPHASYTMDSFYIEHQRVLTKLCFVPQGNFLDSKSNRDPYFNYEILHDITINILQNIGYGDAPIKLGEMTILKTHLPENSFDVPMLCKTFDLNLLPNNLLLLTGTIKNATESSGDTHFKVTAFFDENK